MTNIGGVPVPGEPETLYEDVPVRVEVAAAGRMQEVFAAQVVTVATHLVSLRALSVRVQDEVIWHDTENGEAIDRTLRVEGFQADPRRRGLMLAAREVIS